MGDSRPRSACVLLLTLYLISRVLFTGCWLSVDAELAIGQYRLGVHRTCGLNDPWHHLWKMPSRVGNPGRPPYVIPRGSAGLKKRKKWDHTRAVFLKTRMFLFSHTRTEFTIATKISNLALANLYLEWSMLRRSRSIVILSESRVCQNLKVSEIENVTLLINMLLSELKYPRLIQLWMGEVWKISIDSFCDAWMCHIHLSNLFNISKIIIFITKLAKLGWFFKSPFYILGIWYLDTLHV